MLSEGQIRTRRGYNMNKITDEWEKESERRRKKGIEEEKKEEQQKV